MRQILLNGKPITKNRLGWWVRIALTRLFGSKVQVEGRKEGLRIFPWIYKGRLLLMGAEHEFIQVSFSNQYTAELRSATHVPVPLRSNETPGKEPKMGVHVILCHQAAPIVEDIHRFHESLLEGRHRLIIAYGGCEEEFDKIRTAHKYFIRDPSLRGPSYRMSHTEMIEGAYKLCEDLPIEKCVFVFTESDLLPLKSHYLDPLLELQCAFEAGFMSKSIREITFSNNLFYTQGVNHGIIGPKCIEERIRESKFYHSLGCLFTIDGCLMNEFLGACRSMGGLYFEVMFPTAAALVGARLLSLDDVSTLTKHVRYRPSHTYEDILRIKREGGLFVHPVKTGEMSQYLDQMSPGG